MADEFTTENLVLLLEGILKEIKNGHMTNTHQEHIWNALTFDKNDPEAKKFLRYLFMGWYLHSHLQNTE